MSALPFSPLQLRHCFFTTFSVRAFPGGTPKGKKVMEPSLSFNRAPEEQNVWALGLRLIVKPAEIESPPCYEATIELLGSVEIHKDYPPDKADNLALVNGFSLLYSAAREMYATVTSRCGHGSDYLPILSFADVAKRLQTETAPTSPQPRQGSSA